MAKLLKLRRGTTTQHASFTGAEGEVTIDTTKDTAVVHDGSTQGGTPLAKEDMSNVSSSSIAGRLGTDSIAVTKIAAGTLPSDVKVEHGNIIDGTIRNAEINASAAIAGTKISPNFGSQNITTTGTLTMAGSLPTIVLNDENNENDFNIQNINGTFAVGDIDAGAARLEIASNGTTTIRKNLDCLEGVDVTGNITGSANVDIDGQLQVGSANSFFKQNQLRSNASGAMYFDHGTTGQDINFRTSNSSALDTTGLTIKANGNVDVANGLDVTGTLGVSSGINVTGAINGDRASFKDDGTAGPTVSIMTDDNSPWALAIGNDTYSTQAHKGLMFYQNNDGTMYQQFRGIGSFEGIYFSTSNNTTTENFMHVDASRAVHLEYQDATKLSTTNTGISVTGTVAATSYTGDGSNLTGIQPFPAGTKMLFNQTSAPTGWTKVTTHNNKALRVVSGSAGSGGSNAFTNTLASRGITANAGNTTAAGNVSVANAGVSGNVSIANANTSGTVNNHTLSTNQMPSHSHSLTLKISQHNCRGSGCGGGVQPGSSNYSNGSNSTNNTGGNGAHSHGFSGGAHSHNASFSGSNHSHNASFSGNAHNHSISVGNLDMAVQYVDVIIATKD